jgi:hypothetical protein
MRTVTVKRVKTRVTKAGPGTLAVGRLATGSYRLRLSIRVTGGQRRTLSFVVRR